MPTPTGGPVPGNESTAVDGVPEGLPADVQDEIARDLREAHADLRPPTPDAPPASTTSLERR